MSTDVSTFATRRRLSTNKEEQQRERMKTMVEKMRKRMKEDPSKSKEEGWDQLWKEDVTPWDLNMPTPVLEAELLAASSSKKWNTNNIHKPYRVLVPGCGSSFDLITIAKHLEHLQRQQQPLAGQVRHDSLVVGLDISLTSLKRAEEVLVQQDYPSQQQQQQQQKQTSANDDSPPCCNIILVHGDFFDCTTWNPVYDTTCAKGSDVQERKQPNKTVFQEGMFDLIYDYVFFCALPPNLRESWGIAMSSLLKPGKGRLLTLMFPVFRNPELIMKGPPYPVTLQDYQKVLEPNRVCMESEPYSSPHTVPERAGKELVCWWSSRCGNDPQSSL